MVLVQLGLHMRTHGFMYVSRSYMSKILEEPLPPPVSAAYEILCFALYMCTALAACNYGAHSIGGGTKF